jgi:subtilisin family serine protease
MFRHRACILLAVLAIATISVAADKIVIEKADDLPRHTYTIDTTAVEFLHDAGAMRKLAAELRSDLEADLEAYEIPDKTTLKGFYQQLSTIAFLEGDYDQALELTERARELEEKEAAKLMEGITLRALIAAKKAGADGAEVFERELEKMVAALPYDVVQDTIKQSKAMAEIVSEALIAGQMESTLQPMLDGSGGELSGDMAMGLIGAHMAVNEIIPVKERIAGVYAGYLEAHAEQKPDIWAARAVELPADASGEPVIAVWDSGVDTTIFAKRDGLWVNQNELPNGIDDDENGYVDDVHGIAHDLDSNPTPELLLPIGDLAMDRETLQMLIKGLQDMQANIDSEEATEMKRRISELSQDEVRPFIEEVSAYSNYSHGTHVAGIATEGNPNARVVTARITFSHKMVPQKPTIARAYRNAAEATETIDYMKKAGVRVVNMSWGGSISGIEAALELNNVGESAEERKQLARRIFDIGKVALRDAMAAAPEILFVCAAGNADVDNEFEEFLPASIDLPNLMTVGAVDQAGEETSFTSFGKVDIYANGFEVESYVPGGDRLKFSGTSMSSPNVVNLAAKLLAIDPSLTVAELRELIIQGGDEKRAGERSVLLMNPKRSVELLQQRM